MDDSLVNDFNYVMCLNPNKVDMIKAENFDTQSILSYLSVDQSPTSSVFSKNWRFVFFNFHHFLFPYLFFVHTHLWSSVRDHVANYFSPHIIFFLIFSTQLFLLTSFFFYISFTIPVISSIVSILPSYLPTSLSIL